MGLMFHWPHWLAVGDNEPGATSLPAVITVEPTPSPTHQPPLAWPSMLLPVSGGLDVLFFKPTPTVPPTPEAVPSVYYPASTVEFAFLEGWHDGGGALLKGDAAVQRWITCESNWNVVTAGSYLGLAQFAPSTWGTVASITGYWEWTDPTQHAYNAAVWALMIDPGSRAGWGVCWWR